MLSFGRNHQDCRQRWPAQTKQRPLGKLRVDHLRQEDICGIDLGKKRQAQPVGQRLVENLWVEGTIGDQFALNGCCVVLGFQERGSKRRLADAQCQKEAQLIRLEYAVCLFRL